ncbi:MAG TPA: TonB-dependent siderophore receptor [Noviherbaspirillum sp.]
MNRRLTPLTAALLAAFAAPATLPLHAYGQSASARGATTLPAITVTDSAEDDYAPGVTSIGKTPVPLRDIPQSITVINRAVLEAQNATSLTEALRNVPGITLGAGEGGVIGDNINIRGNSARTDIYLDGMRDRAQYARETFFLESVEVLKGPSSVLFGRGSTGGVINQVSKEAKLRDFNEVSAGIGTDSTYRTTADINRKLSDTSAFRVSAVAHTNESTRDVIESTRYGVAPTLGFGIGTPTEVTISTLHQRRDEIPDYGFPFDANGANGAPAATGNPAKPISTNRDYFFGYTDDEFDQDVDIATLRVTHKFSPNLTLRNQTQYSKAGIHAMPTTITAAGVRNRRERDIDDQSLFNQTDLIAKFDTGAIKHTLVTGIELGREEYENQGYDWDGETNQSLTAPIYGPMPASVTRSSGTLTKNSANTVGVYVNDTIELNKQWKLVGGLRWDRFAFKGWERTNTGAVTELSQTDTMLSHRAGVVYQPSEIESYYLSYGTSFNPSAESITLQTANLNIDPEENRSIELGAKWELMGGNLGLSTALFRIDKKNARSRDTFNNVVGSGETRVNGFEIGATGRITKNWQVFGGYTYLDGEIINLFENSGGASVPRSGNVLPNTPKHSASLWTTYRFASGWEIGGGAVYSDKRFGNNANSAQLPSYTRYDATLAYITKKYDVRLNLQNLSDKEYFEVASGSRATPATGRSAMATVTYRF